MRLLLRLHDPQAGRITFDGIDARALDLTSLRALFAVAPQEGLIVDLTIAENIALGREGAAPAEVEAAALAAGLQPLLASLPEGLRTRVGRGGASLSGGERQRVALARAALRSAPVLLLDEATSAIDDAGEHNLQGWLRAASKTSVAIAHRASTLRGATRTLALEGGRARLDPPAPTT
jgi:ATP-binding cassette subfamily B protein